jgi:hypothetical protein
LCEEVRLSAFRNSGAGRSGVIAAFVGVVVMLSEPALAQPAIPIADIKTLAGKWVGTATSPRYTGPYELTVQEDGTWDSVVPNIPPEGSTGTMKVAGGKATARSDTTKITYDVVLYEREGRGTSRRVGDRAR